MEVVEIVLHPCCLGKGGNWLARTVQGSNGVLVIQSILDRKERPA
jgi:hypothetical protein